MHPDAAYFTPISILGSTYLGMKKITAALKIISATAVSLFCLGAPHQQV
jgi:hypothetical protein